MSHEPPGYMTYLLRLWRAGSAEEPDWRAALENPRTGERQAFGDLESLFAFLQEKTGTRLPNTRAQSRHPEPIDRPKGPSIESASETTIEHLP